MRVKNLLMIVFAGFAVTSQAQSGVVSAGSESTNENGSVSFSVGQVFYNSYESQNGEVSLTQGVQQAYVITSLSIKDVEISSIQLTAYPNPATDVLNLSIVGIENEGLSYRLSDVNGRTQIEGKISSDNTQIDVAQLLVGVYFVEVQQNNKIVRAFKVVKQ